VTQKYDLGTDVSEHEKETQQQQQQRSPETGTKEGADTDLEMNSSPTNRETKVLSNISQFIFFKQVKKNNEMTRTFFERWK
jgi:hypothetical protein